MQPLLGPLPDLQQLLRPPLVGRHIRQQHNQQILVPRTRPLPQVIHRPVAHLDLEQVLQHPRLLRDVHQRRQRQSRQRPLFRHVLQQRGHQRRRLGRQVVHDLLLPRQTLHQAQRVQLDRHVVVAQKPDHVVDVLRIDRRWRRWRRWCLLFRCMVAAFCLCVVWPHFASLAPLSVGRCSRSRSPRSSLVSSTQSGDNSVCYASVWAPPPLHLPHQPTIPRPARFLTHAHNALPFQ